MSIPTFLDKDNYGFFLIVDKQIPGYYQPFPLNLFIIIIIIVVQLFYAFVSFKSY